MFRFVLLFSLFIPFLAQTKDKKMKTQALNKEQLEIKGAGGSLMELLNDTDRLKNELKRDLAEEEGQEQAVKLPESEKKMIQFGNMKLSISKRKEEELTSPSQKKASSSQKKVSPSKKKTSSSQKKASPS